ncbi:MAG: nitronate monooxygenase family protein [Pseudomonadota bacterium]
MAIAAARPHDLPFAFADRLRAPIIVAPMFLVSCPAHAVAVCRAGLVGSYPAHSTRTREVFADWLDETSELLASAEAAGERPAPCAVNLVVHRTNPRMEGDLALCIEHRVPIILTSKGAPGEVFDEIHRYGGITFHDVASQRHAEKALEAGADALIAVAGGAGGHTGTINPFALVNEIREITDKPIVLAGGMSNGRDVLAAQAMGATLAYLGTRFIATHESLAPPAYNDALIRGVATDVHYTAALDGAPANFLQPSMIEAGVDMAELAITPPGEVMGATKSKARYKGIWSAGHGVGATKAVQGAGELAEQLIGEYLDARAELRERLAG